MAKGKYSTAQRIERNDPAASNGHHPSLELLMQLPADHQFSALMILDDATREKGVRLLLAVVVRELAAAETVPDLSAVKVKAQALWETAKQLGADRELDGDVAVAARRAERKFAIAIRDAQRRGEMRSERCKKAGLPSPYDWGSRNEFHGSGSGRGNGIFAMADVDDIFFEEALASARGEGNMFRSNVARKCRDKPKPVRKTVAARKVMEDLIVTISSLAFVVADTDPDEVDGIEYSTDIGELNLSMAAISRFLNKVKDQCI